MRFSVVLSVVIVATIMALYVRATLGSNAIVVLGLIGFWAVYAFFKHVVNA